MKINYPPLQYPRLQIDGAIAHVTLTNSESLNAIYPEAIAELTQLIKLLRDDTGVHVVVFTGAGEKAFIAGADIKRMHAMSSEDAWKFAREGQEMLCALEDMPQVTIAAVNGFALGGGCEFALACDLIHASKKARFGQPEVNLGVIPGFGGTVRLSRRVGLGRANEMILAGATLSGERAYQIGLADGLSEPEQLLADVAKLAQTICSKSPNALSKSKQSVRFALTHERDTAMQFEAELFSACFKHADQKEGMEAFVAKRPPIWGDR